MDRLQLRRQDTMERLLMKYPIPCRVINRKIKKYIHKYEEDKWFEGYSARYATNIILEENEPKF